MEWKESEVREEEREEGAREGRKEEVEAMAMVVESQERARCFPRTFAGANVDI